MTFSKQRSLFFLLANAFNFKWSHMVTLVMAPVRNALYIHSKNRKSSLCTHSAKTVEAKWVFHGAEVLDLCVDWCVKWRQVAIPWLWLCWGVQTRPWDCVPQPCCSSPVPAHRITPAWRPGNSGQAGQTAGTQQAACTHISLSADIQCVKANYDDDD